MIEVLGSQIFVRSAIRNAVGMSEGGPGASYTERMVPEQAHARIFWEHLARYRFAKDFVRGKRTLDIACGEGWTKPFGLCEPTARSAGYEIVRFPCSMPMAN